jgi:hypothetical protein
MKGAKRDELSSPLFFSLKKPVEYVIPYERCNMDENPAQGKS